MKIANCFLAVALLSFLPGCIATTVIRTAPNPGDPIANFPKYCVGDKIVGFGWSNDITSGDTFTAIVENVYDDGSHDLVSSEIRSAKKKLYKKNDKWQVVAARDLTDEKDLPANNPPPNRLDFPLFVGKQWKDAYSGLAVSGIRFEYENTYTVTDFKEIEVEAGKFMAFRIDQEHFNTVYAGSEKPLNSIYYYAPDAKFIIKSIPSWRIGYEAQLVDIKKCD